LAKACVETPGQRYDVNYFWDMLPSVETKLGKDDRELEAKTNGFKFSTDGEAVISDITREIYNESGKKLQTENETGLLAELDPLEWAAIMGIDPMDPAVV
jgi:hypothetical protein